MNRVEAGYATVLGYEKASEISSQKARGIAIISSEDHNFQPLGTVIISVKDALSLNKEDGDQLLYAIRERGIRYSPIVIRACPLTPRHGIINNRMISYPPPPAVELIEMLREFAFSMIEAGEPNGDIAIQPFILADANIVWSDGHAVIAPDFDGATAGKLPAIGLNVPYTSRINKIISKHNGENKDFELEFVINQHYVWWTQIRAATGHKDTGLVVIPGSMSGTVPCPENPKTVREYNILKVKGTDLSVLETIHDKNTLVMHEDGNMLSHAAAHCRQNGWAYVASVFDPKKYEDYFVCEPAPGSVLLLQKPAVGISVSNTDFKKDFFRGIDNVLTTRVESPRQWRALTLAFAFHHFASGSTLNPEIAYLAGVFAGMMLKSACAIVIGEMRHYLNSAMESSLKGTRKMTWELFKEGLSQKFAFAPATERTQIYYRIFSTDVRKHLTRILYTMRACKLMYEKMYWGHSFGGAAWGRVTRSTIRSILAVRSGDLRLVLREINLLTNAAHNCGWAFNKFTDQKELAYFTEPFLGSTYWIAGLRTALGVLQGKMPISGEKVAPAFVKDTMKESFYKIAAWFAQPGASCESHKISAPIKQKPEAYNPMSSCFFSVFGKHPEVEDVKPNASKSIKDVLKKAEKPPYKWSEFTESDSPGSIEWVAKKILLLIKNYKDCSKIDEFVIVGDDAQKIASGTFGSVGAIMDQMLGSKDPSFNWFFDNSWTDLIQAAKYGIEEKEMAYDEKEETVSMEGSDSEDDSGGDEEDPAPNYQEDGDWNGK